MALRNQSWRVAVPRQDAGVLPLSPAVCNLRALTLITSRAGSTK